MKPKSLLILLIFVILLAQPASATQIQPRINRKRQTRKLFVISGLLIFGIGCFLVAGVCAVRKRQNMEKIIRLHDAFIANINNLNSIFRDAMKLSCSRLSSASSLNVNTFAHLKFTINAIRVTQDVSEKEGDFNVLMEKISNLAVPSTKSGLTYLEDQTTENKSFYQTILDSLKTPFRMFAEEPEKESKNKIFKEITSFELLKAMEDASEKIQGIIEKSEAVRKTVCFDSSLIDEMNYYQQVSFQAIDKTARELEASNDLISLFSDPSDYRETWLRNAQKFAPQKASEIKQAIKKNTIWWRIVRFVTKVGVTAVSQFTPVELTEKGISLAVLTELSTSVRQLKDLIQKGESKPIMDELKEIGKNAVFDLALRGVASVFSVAFAKIVIPAKALINGVISLVQSYKQVKKTEQNLREERMYISQRVDNAVIFANFKTTAVGRTALINYNLFTDMIEQGMKSIDLNCEEKKKILICKQNLYLCGIYYGKEFARTHSKNNRLCANSLTMIESNLDSNDIYHKGFEAISSKISKKFKVSPTFSSLNSDLVFISTQTSKLASHEKALEEAYKQNPAIKKHSSHIISKTIQLQEDHYLHAFAISEQNMTSEIEEDLCPLTSEVLDQIPIAVQAETNIDKKLVQIRKDNRRLLLEVCNAVKHPEEYFTEDDKYVVRSMVRKYFGTPDTYTTYHKKQIKDLTQLRPIPNRSYMLNVLDGIRIGFNMTIDYVDKDYDWETFRSYLFTFSLKNVSSSDTAGMHSFDSYRKSNCNLTPFYNEAWMGYETITGKSGKWRYTKHGQDLYHFNSRIGSRYHESVRAKYSQDINIQDILTKHGLTADYTIKSGFTAKRLIPTENKSLFNKLKDCPYFFQSAKVVIENLDSSKGYSFKYTGNGRFDFDYLEVLESEEGELLFEPNFILLFNFSSVSNKVFNEQQEIFYSTSNKFRHFGYYPLSSITKSISKAIEVGDSKGNLIGHLFADIFLKPFKTEGTKELERICDSY